MNKIYPNAIFEFYNDDVKYTFFKYRKWYDRIFVCVQNKKELEAFYSHIKELSEKQNKAIYISPTEIKYDCKTYIVSIVNNKESYDRLIHGVVADFIISVEINPEIKKLILTNFR